MIKLSGVGKRYGAMVAVHPTDLVLEEGKVTALIGPSGCGKSTLLRLMLGLVSADSGTIEIGASRLTTNTELELRRKVGYVIQDGGLFPHLTARENVLLLPRHLRADLQNRVEELAKLTRLPLDALDRYPLEMSGGQRQRVALMRALALDPPILLLDEPLAALDPIIRSELQSDLKAIFTELGNTVVLVTHDMGEAAYLADHIVLMREGHIVQSGSLADFQERPAEQFVTDFLNAQRTVVAL
jgi:osmoprotectant transport system ATP-binding protein